MKESIGQKSTSIRDKKKKNEWIETIRKVSFSDKLQLHEIYN